MTGAAVHEDTYARESLRNECEEAAAEETKGQRLRKVKASAPRCRSIIRLRGAAFRFNLFFARNNSISFSNISKLVR